MSVTLTGSEGLFTRLGRVGKALYRWNDYQNGIRANFEALYDQYPNDYALLGNLPGVEDQLKRSESGLLAQAQTVATNTLITMVTNDVPTVNATVYDCLVELFRQMRASANSVAKHACTVTATAISGSTGTGVLRTSKVRPDGLDCELIIAETARLVCSGDFQSGTATAEAEPFTFTGEPNLSRATDYDWPQGSGVTMQVAANDGSSNTLLTGGGFDTWASLSPTGWTLSSTTDITEQTGAYDGGSAMRFAAGTTPNALQALNDLTAGNKLTPLSAYCVNFWARSSAALSAGNLRVELVDGSSTVINDDQGTANQLNVAFGSLSTSWASFSAFFRTPRVLTDDIDIRIRASTAFTGGAVDVDRMSLVAPSAYAGGYGFAVFSGATKFVKGDGWTIAGTNDRSSATYAASWQSLFERLFGMSSLGLQIPSSGSPTIADAIITS